MTQLFPVREEGTVRKQSLLLPAPLPSPTPLPVLALSTFGDDASVMKCHILSTAAGDDGDRRMQSQAFLEAHGEEGHLGQVIPKEALGPSSKGHKRRLLPHLLQPVETPADFHPCNRTVWRKTQ